MQNHKNPRTQMLALGIVCLMAMTASPTMASEAPATNVLEESMPPFQLDNLGGSAPESLGTSGIYFEENLGQFPDHVRFLVRGASMHVFLTNAGATFVLSETDGESSEDPRGPGTFEESVMVNRTEYAVMLDYADANPTPIAVGGELLPSYSNHYKGNDPTKWVTHAPHYGQVTQHDVWPGIDVTWYEEPGQGLKFDAVISPGADPSLVQFAAQGAQALYVDEAGRLVIETPLGNIVKDAPYTYQQASSVGVEDVSTNYNLAGNMITFTIGKYDATRTLIIDPLVYSTFLGGSSEDNTHSIAVDSSGYAHVVGDTESTNYPTSPGAYQTTFGGDRDVFVAKFSPLGSLVYSTYLGGSDVDFGNDVAIGPSGNIFITGSTYSMNYPTSTGAYQTTFGGYCDIYVTMLANGGSLVYSTFFGNTGSEEARGVAVDANGDAIIAGVAYSSSYPTTTGAYQTSFGGSSDAFVTKLSIASSSIVYSTFLGGSDTDYAQAVEVDSSGNAHVIGSTYSSDFPVTSGAVQPSYAGGVDVFVVKVSAAGNSLAYSTYHGGAGWDNGKDIALDHSGNSYVTGYTYSEDFPTTPGAPKTRFFRFSSVRDAFVTKLPATGDSLTYSTYLGGNGIDSGDGIAVDSNGNAYVVGQTKSTNFYTTPGAYQPDLTSSSYDLYMVKLSTNGDSFDYSTYLGGSNDEIFGSVGMDSSDNVYIAGATKSTDYPTTTGAYQTSLAGVRDAAVTVLDLAAPSKPNSPNVQCATPHGTLLTWQAPAYGGLSTVTQYKIYSDISTNPTTLIDTVSASQTSYEHVPAWTTDDWFYRVSAVNGDGESSMSSEVSQAPCDFNGPEVTGLYQSFDWSMTVPPLSSWQWTDDYSGLNNVQYRVESGGSVFQDWANLPLQPSLGSLGPWSSTWTPTVAEGINEVSLRGFDLAGNDFIQINAYEIKYDALSPTSSGATAIISWVKLNPVLSSVCFQDATSGLATSNRYWVGSSSGASDRLSATAMPVQPTSGDLEWCPEFQITEGILQDGVNHVTIEVTDQAGNTYSVPAYEIQFDSSNPTATGAIVTTPWSNENPILDGVCFQDVDSGLEATASYWIGSMQGASDLLVESNMPVQPASGQSTSWCPSFQVPESALQDGVNHVTVEVTDLVGHVVATPSYEIQYDSTGDGITGLQAQSNQGGASIPENTWQPDDSPYYAWSEPVGNSPTSGYSYSLSQNPSVVPDEVVNTTGTNADYTSTSLATGAWYFRIKAMDGGGNWGGTSTFLLLVDVIVPTSTGGPLTTAWTNTTPNLAGVCYQDVDSGLKAEALYALGSSSGASDVQAASAMPVQPSDGENSPWCPSFEVPEESLLQGSTFVTVEVSDRAGMDLETPSYEIRYDNVPDDLSGLQAISELGGGALPLSSWQSDNTPYFVWNAASSTSPILGYSYVLTQDSSEFPDNEADTQNAFADPGVLADGIWYFRLKAVDEAGNTGSVVEAALWVDATLPTSSGSPVMTPWSKTSPELSGICFQDPTSGLENNAQYRVGADPGTGTWTAVPVQPTNGQTSSWCPVFSVPEAALVQGSNHIGIRVLDQAGNELVSTAYEVRFDNVADAVVGLGAFDAPNGIPYVEASWQEDRSPFFDWSATSTSPITGYSITWFETASVPDEVADQSSTGYEADTGSTSAANGKWSFQVRAVDEAGNWGPAEEFAYWLDDLGPGMGSIGSSTHGSTLSYYNRTTASFSWSSTDFDGSGTVGYANELVLPGGVPSDLTTKTTTPDESASFTDVGSFGVYTFRVQAVDNEGHWGPVKTRVINVDAIPPEYTRLSPSSGVTVSNPLQSIRVLYNDFDNGFDDPLSPVTEVDASSVLFFVDGVNIEDVWGPICGPTGPLYGAGCRLDVTSSGITFEPLLPWTEGEHVVDVQVQDTVVDANIASTQWAWTYRTLEGVDPNQYLFLDVNENVAPGTASHSDNVTDNPLAHDRAARHIDPSFTEVDP